jgi:hypothetical protein
VQPVLRAIHLHARGEGLIERGEAPGVGRARAERLERARVSIGSPNAARGIGSEKRACS